MKEGLPGRVFNKIFSKENIKSIAALTLIPDPKPLRPDLIARNRALGLPDDWPDAKEFYARVTRDEKVDQQEFKKVNDLTRRYWNNDPRKRKFRV